MKILGLIGLLLALNTASFAGSIAAPEIDGNSIVAGLALVSGGLLILKARKKSF